MKKFINKLKEISINIYDGIGAYDETSLQTAIGIEFRENKIKFLREFNIEVFYKNYPLTLNELDFLIYPNKDFDLNEPIILETKLLTKLDDSSRQQLKNYLKSAPFNSYEDLKRINKGILLNFKKILKYFDDINIKPDNDEKTTLEIWQIKDGEFLQIKN